MILSNSRNSLTFAGVPWDSEAFGFPVYDLISWSLSELDSELEGRANWVQRFGNLDSHSKAGRVLLTARVPANDRAVRSTLEALSFVPVEWTLHPKIEISPSSYWESRGITIRSPLDDESEWLLDEAAEAFTVSRYFADLKIDESLAKLRFRNWILSALRDEKKQVLIFEAPNEIEPIAFFVVSVLDGKSFLELTAMAKQSRGRGLALGVWGAYLNFARQSGVIEVKTNISAENSGVIGIYPRLGFRFSQPSVAYHGHFF